MASPAAVDSTESPSPAPPETESQPSPRRGRLAKILIGAALALVVLLLLALFWFFFGREQAKELTEDDALSDFRADSGSSTATEGLPAAGVYTATASGQESIGLPGFDESLGPSAPVTVTYGDDGCYIYRADFNSHHWRAWTFCPTETATFALRGLESWTARKATGLDIATLSTYTCELPVDFFWSDMATGDTRAGACTGTSDADDSVTDDAGQIEVLAADETITVDGEEVPVVRVKLSDTLSGDQTGTEIGTWWLDSSTGLPLRISTEASLSGGLSDYDEQIDLELTTLTPAT